MITSTTDNLEGFKIIKYLGVVIGYGDDPDDALEDLIDVAKDMGANAVIGIRISNELTTEIISDENYAVPELTYYAYGTAVIVEKIDDKK
ncbi:heavy metal-binding domain-containing protein [Methanocaldococcus sp. 16A]